ncbi:MULTISPECIES: TRM11 family methyltransferase [Campylobacter]|uniref:TRM11 family SAM-dependent methyltransferase n=1 Tax=Campylobacter TaxID=194 RepID=UPI0023F38B15|nr:MULTISPECIES: DNA methyltransferase [Campylobacter]MCI6641710.1 site-specific DNA-methyltransferase [Campylobacter sp.]MDD7422908.1 DNA methyltransferase [Campylobacter hominis]MDY3117299.1 DNA methyltransferase [Campylobacter hominis]
MKFNDLDMNNWRNLGINVDSLQVYESRDRGGKHKNIYHGNFIPQIPNQLIRRYTKENELVIEPFMGSGTTLFECESLNRKYIGIDINSKIIEYVRSQMQNSDKNMFEILEFDSSNSEIFKDKVSKSLQILDENSAKFAIFHPPYMDIVKFTNLKQDLSQISNLKDFLNIFIKVVENTLLFLEKNRYFAVVIGDVYKNSEVLPLGFYVMHYIKLNFKVKLKGIIVKNIEGNRGKLKSGGIWTYRALKSDYYIFKHEYILVFKKEF